MQHQPSDIVRYYHERTKHYPQRYARSPGYLDWDTQPNPFRRFSGAELVPLVLDDDPGEIPYDGLFHPNSFPPQLLDLHSLSALFEYALGLSAWKSYRGSTWALRMNPSSGNLHPTEGYAILPAVSGLTDHAGVFHYAPKEHALERRCRLDVATWCAIRDELILGKCCGDLFFVGLASIHWREAWKYGERAYRYCQHDVGHALAALAFSAALLGWTLRPLHHLRDNWVAALLGLDRAADFADAEAEQPDLLAAVFTDPRSNETDARHYTAAPEAPTDDQVKHAAAPASPAESPALRALAQCPWTGRANRLSSEHVDWDIIDRVTEACRKSHDSTAQATAARAESQQPNDKHEPACNSVTADPAAGRDLALTLSGAPGAGGATVHRFTAATPTARQFIRQRRSAVDMDGQTSMPAERFFGMLTRTQPRWDAAPWNALGPPACVHLVLFVHRVVGLEPGAYILVRGTDAEPALRAAMRGEFSWRKTNEAPGELPLFHLLAGDCRAFAAHASCDQTIASHGIFACAMLAEFEPRLVRHSPWFYRRLFWETGVIGQVLYLEAEAAGLRGTGIGCYFDDVVHQALGLTGREFQSLYHFTVGGPVEDSRLTTLPPYSDRSRERP